MNEEPKWYRIQPLLSECDGITCKSIGRMKMTAREASKANSNSFGMVYYTLESEPPMKVVFADKLYNPIDF
jgi:hypothetical protein